MICGRTGKPERRCDCECPVCGGLVHYRATDDSDSLFCPCDDDHRDREERDYERKQEAAEAREDRRWTIVGVR